MTDPIDIDLRDRLAALAAAVPVEVPGSTFVVHPQIGSGSVGRRFAFGGLVPVLAILVAGAVFASIMNLGPFAPGSTANPTRTANQPNGPVIATASEGPFVLTVTSTKARYTPDEPIEIEASLTYQGPDPIQIAHGQGARGSALGFGIEEPVLGDLRLTPGVLESCERSILEPGVPLNVAFQKSGGFSGDHPRTAEYRAYFDDPVLRLPVGTWHVYGVAGFSIDTCSPDPIELRAEIAIDVVPAEVASDAPSPPNPPQSVTDHDGDFELTLRSDKTTYRPDELIEVTGSLVYRGPDDRVEISHDSSGMILFGSREPVYEHVNLLPGTRLMCMQSVLERHIPVDMPFRKGGGFPTDHPDVDFFRAFMLDPTLRLPAGTWHLYAVSSGGCMAGPESPQFALEAEITIEVSGGPVILPPSTTVPAAPTPQIGPDESPGRIQPDGSVLDVVNDGTFELRLRAAESVYLENEPIDVEAQLRYLGLEAVELSGSVVLGFGVREIGGSRGMGWGSRAVCRPLGSMSSDEPERVIPFAKSGGYAQDDPNREFAEDYFSQPELRLPEGMWMIYALTAFSLGEGCAARGPDLTASVEVKVVSVTIGTGPTDPP